LELLSPNSFPVPSQQTTMFLGIGYSAKPETPGFLRRRVCDIFADSATGGHRFLRVGQ